VVLADDVGRASRPHDAQRCALARRGRVRGFEPVHVAVHKVPTRAARSTCGGLLIWVWKQGINVRAWLLWRRQQRRTSAYCALYCRGASYCIRRVATRTIARSEGQTMPRDDANEAGGVVDVVVVVLGP
jgi:hypothetical protein